MSTTKREPRLLAAINKDIEDAERAIRKEQRVTAELMAQHGKKKSERK